MSPPKVASDLIVISFSLVVVAFALLLVGIFTSGLTLVYISIGVSVVSGALLLIGVLQRRGDTGSGARTATLTGPAVAAAVAAAGSAVAAGATSDPAVAPSDPVGAGIAGSVGAAAEGFAVVPAAGAGVRSLLVDADRAADDASAPDADQDVELFSRSVAERFRPPAPGPAAPGPAAPGPAATSEGDVVVVSGRPRYHVGGCRFVAGHPDAEAIPVEEAREVGFTPCGACRPDEALVGGAARAVERVGPVGRGGTARLRQPPSSTEGPADEGEPVAAAGSVAKVARAAGPRSSVVIIPERAKFHLPACRFARNAPGAVSLTRASAVRQGYAPCGVCKP